MKGKVIVSPCFFRIFLPSWATGFALFPFILVKSKPLSENDVLINHEKIHIQQQKEMLVVFFYIWYVLEYLFRWVQTGSKLTAYKKISFEREAYAHQNTPTYIRNRKFWAHLRWL